MAVFRLFAIPVLVLMAGAAFAGAGGEVRQTTGAVVMRPDGTSHKLSRTSEVNAGDTLTTRADGSALVTFPDAGSLWVHPNSRVKIESYRFIEQQPEADRAHFHLLKGGIRTQTGIVGKRNPDDYAIMTRAGVISPRGSGADTMDCTRGWQGCKDFVADGRKPKKGVYHSVFNGSYVMHNGAGTLLVSAGETAYARDDRTAPVIVSVDPPRRARFSLPHDTRSPGSIHGAPHLRMRVKGRYQSSFERSAFLPCGRQEEWWIKFPECQSEACDRVQDAIRSCEAPDCDVYLDATLDVSRAGVWGHMGGYEREVLLRRLHRVSLKPLGTCR